MPKVSVGLFTEKNARFIRNVRSGLVKNGKESKDLTTRTGRCVKTVYNKYKEPEKLTVTELRAFMMTWLIENWMVVFGLAVAVIIAVLVVYRFFGMPTDKQIAKIKEWLVWACIEAEKALQSGTGQLKLRGVYNMFCAVPAFTWVAKLISFELFSDWVSDALVTVKEMLVSNEALAMYVYGNKANVEIKKIKEQLKSQ